MQNETDLTPLIPAALTEVHQPAPETPPTAGDRLVLRRMTRAGTLPVDEDLNPASPEGPTPAERLVEVTHDTTPPMPAAPDASVFATQFVLRIDVRLPWGDDRVSSVRLLADRLRGVLDGDLLTPPEATAALHGSPKPVRVADTNSAPSRSPAGRPTLPRHGTITTPDGRNQSGFWSMAELAAQLGAPYAGVNQKYLSACREQSVDPNDHDGVTFVYKGHTIHLVVR